MQDDPTRYTLDAQRTCRRPSDAMTGSSQHVDSASRLEDAKEGAADDQGDLPDASQSQLCFLSLLERLPKSAGTKAPSQLTTTAQTPSTQGP